MESVCYIMGQQVSKNAEPPSISRRHDGDIRQIPY